MWPALRSRESRLDFATGALPAGATHTRASKAWGFDYRGVLTEYANDAPVHDYDPALPYNLEPNPWADGGDSAPTLPTGYSVVGGGSITPTYLGRGTRNGVPYTRWRLQGTSTGAAWPTIRVAPYTSIPAVVGDAYALEAHFEVVRRGVTNTAADFYVAHSGTTAAGVAMNEWSRDAIPSTWTFGNGPRRISRTLATGTTAYVEMFWQFGQIAGTVWDVDFEIGFPIITRGTAYLTEKVQLATLAARVGGVPQYGLRGLLTEPPATNGIIGARAEGTPGTPGALPPSWSYANMSVSTQVVGVGLESGIPYIDVRVFGSPPANTNTAMYFQTATGVAAALGETWTASAYLRLVGGSWAGVAMFGLVLNERNSDGVLLAGESTAIYNPGAAPLVQQRRSLTRTMTEPTVAAARFGVRWTVAAGVPVDFTLRIAGVQQEQSPVATSLILPPVGAPAAPPRAATTVSLATYAAANMAGDTERIMELSMELVPGTTGGMLWATGPDIGERDELYVDPSTGRLNYQAFRGGTRRINSLFSPAGTLPRYVTAAIQQKRNSYAASYQAGAPTTYAQDYAIPAVTTLRLGHQNSDNQVAGWIRSFRHWHEAADRVDLVRIGTVPDDGTGDPWRSALVKVQAGMADLFGALTAPPAIGTGAPTPGMDGPAGFPIAASYLDAAKAVWWLSLAEQDDAARWAPLGSIDHPGYIAGRWYGANNNAAGGSSVQAAGFIYYAAHPIAHQVTIDRISIATGSTVPDGKKIRLGIYANNPAACEPGDLLLDPGVDIAPAAAGAPFVLVLPVPITLPPGIYWFAACCESTPNLRGDAHGNVNGGGPAPLRGTTSSIYGLMAGSQFGGALGGTQCRVVSRTKYEFRAGVPFLPINGGDVVSGSNTPTSPYFSWRAA